MMNPFFLAFVPTFYSFIHSSVHTFLLSFIPSVFHKVMDLECFLYQVETSSQERRMVSSTNVCVCFVRKNVICSKDFPDSSNYSRSISLP